MALVSRARLLDGRAVVGEPVDAHIAPAATGLPLDGQISSHANGPRCPRHMRRRARPAFAQPARRVHVGASLACVHHLRPITQGILAALAKGRLSWVLEFPQPAFAKSVVPAGVKAEANLCDDGAAAATGEAEIAACVRRKHHACGAQQRGKSACQRNSRALEMLWQPTHWIAAEGPRVALSRMLCAFVTAVLRRLSAMADAKGESAAAAIG